MKLIFFNIIFDGFNILILKIKKSKNVKFKKIRENLISRGLNNNNNQLSLYYSGIRLAILSIRKIKEIL